MPYVESALRSKQAVTAARAVLMRDGVGGTTMRAVATEAGIPLGTPQYVFPTKQGLLRAVIEEVVEEIADLLRSSAELEGRAGTRDPVRVAPSAIESPRADADAATIARSRDSGPRRAAQATMRKVAQKSTTSPHVVGGDVDEGRALLPRPGDAVG
jgi:AcrR family transcriptional regulator